MKNYKPIFILFALVLLATAIMHISSETHVSTIYNCKITNLQQQQLIKGKYGNMETEIRYLVVTDKGTFICESSIINKKSGTIN